MYLRSKARKAKKIKQNVVKKTYFTRSTTRQTTLKKSAPRKKAKSLVRKENLCTLPDDILIEIFSHLDLKSISKCAMSCSRLNYISKYSTLYKTIHLKYDLSPNILKSLLSKASCLKRLSIEYQTFDYDDDLFDYLIDDYLDYDIDDFLCDQFAHAQDNKYFEKYIKLFIQQLGGKLDFLEVVRCRNRDILLSISKCTNLKELNLTSCKSNFETLITLGNLKKIKFKQCNFSQNTTLAVAVDIIKNNVNLKKVHLVSNTNVDINKICETLSLNNLQVTDLHLRGYDEINDESIRSLQNLINLKSLVLCYIKCDPVDSLPHLLAACRKLETFEICEWAELNDNNFIPALDMLRQLTKLRLDLTDITIKSCRRAVEKLPRLKEMHVHGNGRVHRAQLAKLQKKFADITIPYY
ncbi:unnamed protein product [Brassicogethes aeneus]|uniref:F-box domain-containing protein n=1 Tax=Brassicogethes aeneus TaxID=1431903 RepID=A0A9P0FDB3_BRAAE|nr:unnamed protein product [Brassicogethes aeneus]